MKRSLATAYLLSHFSFPAMNKRTKAHVQVIYSTPILEREFSFCRIPWPIYFQIINLKGDSGTVCNFDGQMGFQRGMADGKCDKLVTIPDSV